MSDWKTLADSLSLTLRPIDVWPGTMTPAWSREKGPFSAPLKETLTTLKRELNALAAKSIVLQIAIKEAHLRLDGLPRAGATAEHPGVVLSFKSKHGFLRLAFDRFTKWENNLRAIALHLENLRHASLYGVGSDGQQYAGWKALPPGERSAGNSHAIETTSAPSDHDAAAVTIFNALPNGSGFTQSGIATHPNVFKAAWLEAVKRTHPDSGGTAEAFHAVQHAAEVLKRRHGL